MTIILLFLFFFLLTCFITKSFFDLIFFKCPTQHLRELETQSQLWEALTRQPAGREIDWDGRSLINFTHSGHYGQSVHGPRNLVLHELFSTSCPPLQRLSENSLGKEEIYLKVIVRECSKETTRAKTYCSQIKQVKTWPSKFSKEKMISPSLPTLSIDNSRLRCLYVPPFIFLLTLYNTDL